MPHKCHIYYQHINVPAEGRRFDPSLPPAKSTLVARLVLASKPVDRFAKQIFQAIYMYYEQCPQKIHISHIYYQHLNNIPVYPPQRAH